MAANKRSGPPAGFEKRTVEFEGEWVTPEQGTVVQGTLTRAFTFSSEYGKQNAYVIGEGKQAQILSERAFLKCLQSCNLNDEIYVEFVEQVAVPGKKGQSVWKGEVYVQDAKKPGAPVSKFIQLSDAPF